MSVLPRSSVGRNWWTNARMQSVRERPPSRFGHLNQSSGSSNKRGVASSRGAPQQPQRHEGNPSHLNRIATKPQAFSGGTREHKTPAPLSVPASGRSPDNASNRSAGIRWRLRLELQALRLLESRGAPKTRSQSSTADDLKACGQSLHNHNGVSVMVTDSQENDVTKVGRIGVLKTHGMAGRPQEDQR